MESLNPATIPLFKKRQFLKEYSEDRFRDEVVRPLFLLKDLTHGKDVCGSDEDGKDCYFWGTDAIRGRILYVVQTKKGDVKMSAKARENLLNIESQLQTALRTPVYDATSKQKLWPDYVILVVSGEINKKAEEHITREIGDPRIVFRDADDLIRDIDEHIPQLWYGIDVRRFPYLRALRDQLVAQSDTIDLTQLGVGATVAAPITDDNFVQLYLHRFTTKPTRRDGKVDRTLDLQEFPVQKVLQRPEKVILITGEAGAGKTTSLRRLAMIMVQDALSHPGEVPIPVFLHATNIAGAKHDLAAVTANMTKRLFPAEASAFSLDDLRNGLVVILIDAFDEVTDPAERQSLIRRIAEFHEHYQKCQIILTSRDYPFVREATKELEIVRFNISPINLKQAERMVNRLARGKELSAHQSQELLRRLDSVHGMELNPLLVTIFVATTDYARTDIPANITELFKKFTEIMLGRWDQSKGLAQQYQAQVKDFLLCRVAFEMHRKRATSIELEEVREIMEAALSERDLIADLEVLFEETIHRSGLVRVDDGMVIFRHLLLQEFFAGRGIPEESMLAEVAADFWWTRPIVFYFGERPEDHVGLAKLRSGLAHVAGSDRFQAAVTVGLALQACYLTKTEHRRESLLWVTESMAESYEPALAHFFRSGAGETLQVVFYYLYGRDAVATGVMKHLANYRTPQMLLSNGCDGEDADREDLQKFWCIVGLIEARQFETAQAELRGYHPRDQRLLLAIHVGLYQIERLQVTSDSDKKFAKKLRQNIEPQIAHLQRDVIDELKGYLLEIREGRVERVDETPSQEEELATGDGST